MNTSRNNIIIDQMPDEHIEAIHKALDTLRDQYNIRLRIKNDGRTNQPLRELPHNTECGYTEEA